VRSRRRREDLERAKRFMKRVLRCKAELQAKLLAAKPATDYVN
jgi:hypothetical protein